MDSDILPDKLATDRNLLKFFEIDFEQLSIYLKKLTDTFPDEDAYRKAIK